MYAYKEEQKPASNFLTDDEEEYEEPEAPESAIVRRDDGTYCWQSEMDLRRDNWMLGFLMKAILIPSGVLFMIALVLAMSDGASIRNVLMGYGILLAVLGVVAVIIWFSHWLTTWAMGGRMTMHYEMDESGITFLSGREKYKSSFRGIRTIRADRESNRLYLNSWFLYNVICVEEQDFDFVAEYITSRCPNARIISS